MLRVLAIGFVAAGAFLRPQSAPSPKAPRPSPPRCVSVYSVPRGPTIGTTLAARVNVRSGPSTTDAVLFQLGELQTVTVQERGACSDAEDCWHRIEAGPGRQGWVSGGLLQPGFSVEELVRMRALAPAILFDVRRSLAPVADDDRCPSRAYVEPIVEISQRLAPPPSGVEPESTIPMPEGLRRFLRTYFQPGRRYRLLGSPTEASVTIVKRLDLSCVSVGACVRLEGAVAAAGHLLATDSPRLAPPPAARALSAEDSQRAAALARARFQAHGLRASLAQGSPLELYEGIAADLDGDGARELIVAAGFTSPRVAEGALPDCAARVALVVDGRTGDVQELWTSAGDAEMGPRDEIVGLVDVDGDGVFEVVLRVVGYEAWEYHLFRRVGGRWLEVYAGAGGGC